MNYVELFSQAVLQNAEKCAIIDDNGARGTSYAQLDALSGQVAGKLHKLSCGVGDFILVKMPRCMEYIAAYIGILKAGCAVVPVTDEYPIERIDYIKKNCSAKFVIEKEFFADLDCFEAYCAPALSVDPALLLYTSGSTGTPKGILYTNADLAAAALRSRALFSGIDTVNYAAACPLSFIAHVTEYLTIILLGGCSNILSDEIRKSVKALTEYYEKNRITVGIITPQLLKLFPQKVPYLKRVITGSERVSRCYSPEYEIYNVYGMSETGHISLFSIDKTYDNTPVGKPLDGIRLVICDAEGDGTLPDGTEGEICIEGPFHVSYYKDPEKTASTMLPLPDGRTRVRTCDIGYIDASGELVFVERKDWMVKVNGQRVETLEIEHVLVGTCGISDAAVKAFTDADGQNYLAGFYVASRDISESAIREALRQKLPGYMLPRFLVKMDALPKNINGKLDRKSLASPIAEQYKSEYVPPETEAEIKVCAAFEAVLKCGKVGVNDDFYTLGGDSIKVLRLIEALSPMPLTPDGITESRTPRGIAAQAGEAAALESAKIAAIPSEVPLSESQLGVYLDNKKDPETTAYSIVIRITLPSGIDKARFLSAARQVIDSHRILFVSVGEPGGVPSMIYKGGSAEIHEINAEDALAEERSLQRPYDLENGPLYRLTYVSTPSGDTFLIGAHHIIFDGSSVALIVREISAMYNNGMQPEPEWIGFEPQLLSCPADPEAEQKYRSYFEAQFGGRDCDSKPVPDMTLKEIPDRRNVICVPSDGRLDFSRTSAFTKQYRVSENALFLAAFGYTLAKFNGTDSCVFTTAHHGRMDGRLAGAAGMFVRTLPFLCKFNDDMSPIDYITDVGSEYSYVKRSCCVPFTELAAEYGITMSVSFVYQAEMFSAAEFDGKKADVKLLHTDDSVSDLEFMLMKTPNSYRAELLYHPDTYTAEFIRSFAETFFNVVQGMLEVKALKEICLADRAAVRLLDTFNRTETPYDTEKTVIDLFREQAQLHPDAECLVYKDKRFTYREADLISDRIAARLVHLGCGKGQVAGVLIPRCEYMLLCSLSVLKAGAAYMPLDPAYPKERLNLMMKDSGASFLISTPELSEIITDEFDGQRLMTDSFAMLPDADIVLPHPEPADRFILLYTSGSTGTPKGVIYNHINPMVTAAWVRKSFAMDVGAKIAAYASYGFDANVFDTYPVITSGASLHIIADDIRLDLPALRDYFNINKITHCVMTTQVGKQFIEMGAAESLKYLSVAGEKLPAIAPDTGYTLRNLYGPTEGSVLVSCFTVDRQYRDIPIGTALDNVKFYVTDSCGRRLPIGAAGELWFAGPHVTQGYLNRPDKTAQAFGKNPFDTCAGYERIYRTGDIVRMLPDGNLQFIGRRDGQIKIRGFRVELTEVEEVIRRFPGIKDATVAAFDAENGQKYLTAYVVSDAKVDINALNAFIRAEKPAYMVPAVTMQLDAIPLNQNQKVNKKALPKPQRSADNIVLPETELQSRIYEIVAEVIGHRQFGIDTDLIEAGLTSIGSLRLNVQLSKAFDASIRLNDIKRNPTVRQLETLFTAQSKSNVYEIAHDYPLTQTQMGIYVECAAAPQAVTYNIPLLMKLGTSVDAKRLASAIKAVLNAHPYVKTTLFANAEGDIRALRNDAAEAAVEIIRCERLPAPESLVVPFELIGGALYRVKIFITADGTYLFTDFHHIIFDGTSELILLKDIDAAYAGKAIEKERFSGFEAALKEADERTSEHYSKAKAYYDSVFSGCEPNCLPPKAPESDISEAAALHTTLEACADEVEKFCSENRITPNAFFNTAFACALGHFVRLDDVVYSTIYNGRSDSALVSCLSMLVKTLPVLVHVNSEDDVLGLIRATQKQLLDSMSNDIYSYAEIAAAYGIRSDVIFVYQGEDFTFDRLCGEKAEVVDINISVAKAPITVNVYLKQGRYELTADYRRDMYNSAFMKSLLSVFDMLVKGFLTKRRVSEIPVLSEEADAWLKAVNDTDRPLMDGPVNSFVERAAAAHPERIAVVSDGKKLTYAQLNAQANRIAHALISLDVKTDDIVGMMLGRSCEISVVELAILKAGGAFLGILPEYPDERIEYCMTDADSPVLITTEAIKRERPALTSDAKSYRTVTVEELLSCADESNPELPIAPDSLAYCIYTSGSTGKPKGVLIAHRNLVCCAQPADSDYAFYHGNKRGSVALAIVSISFDMSLLDNMLLLMNGMTVCIATEAEVHNPVAIARIMRENHVDTMVATPSFLTNALCAKEFREVVGQLHALVAGGEVFQPSLFDELRGLNSGLRIINGYGPSECTVTCCGKDIEDSRHITIGKPGANVKFYVVDAHGNILPPYACGELIICGKLVGRGYRNLPEKTAAAFFTLMGLPAYHSGDIVRMNNNGEVEYYGRKDNQVKLRGFRVELDEIEKCICSYDGVTQSKVIIRNNGAEDYLCGFFTAEMPVALEKLTEHLKSKLTYYMVPDALMQLESMPLTANGKIDKKQLPKISPARRKSSRKAPKKSLEQELCELFGSVLSESEYFSDDNFFEMGGTSLSASKVVMQLMAKGCKVAYQDIFSNPTPETLAEFLERQKRADQPEGTEDAPENKADEFSEELKYNTLSCADIVSRAPLGDVLLTGAVGFLGIHILKTLLDSEEGRIICLVRKGDFATPEIRLKSMLMYYFGVDFDELLEKRVTVLAADITDDNLSESLKGFHFDTIINCAACVKHYSADDRIEKINVHGVENLIAIAKARSSKLIQISTTSVPGVHTEESWKQHKVMHENELFVINDMDNKYCISKYRAEQKMLTAIREGMRGKIIRVGNLMGRHSDGEFQINFNTNAFLNALRGFATIGKCPISHATDPMSFSPIDLTAKAVVLLSGTNDCFTAFHADNRFGFDEWQLVEAANKCGLSIKPVPDKEYYADYYRMLGDPKVNARLQGLVTNDRPDLHAVETSNTFTANILYRLGFAWPVTDEAYLKRAINSLITLDYFAAYDEEN